MKAGKLSESVLNRSVLRQLHTENGLFPPETGSDFSAFSPEHGEAVVSAVETRCFRDSVSAGLSVYAAVNNLVCSGARPIGVLLNLLLPTEFTENGLRDLISRIDNICGEEELAVLGGHTEVIREISEPYLTVTALGTVESGKMVSVSGVKPGMDVLVTKWIALEGTCLLASSQEETLKSRFCGQFIDRAKKFGQYLSVRSEAAVAARSGVAAMHDISEGGIFGALWEMGQRSGVGLEIDLKKIPIRQETVEICEFFDLNPYRLVSGGSLLLASEDGNHLAQILEKNGIHASVIGRVTSGSDRVLNIGEERRFLERTQTDELWKLEK